MTVPFVRAVVLNYNGGQHVLDCIEALTHTDWPADRFEIVMLDNASSDGSEKAVAERFGSVRVQPTGANLGFPANNLAMRDLDGIDYVALVNNDAFVEPGWLAPLVEVLQADTGLGAACPKILFAPRFVEIIIESPTFNPPGDGRDLGVRIHEVAADGHSTFGLTQFIAGCWGVEHTQQGPFRWTSGRAVLRVPAGEAGSNFGFTNLRLAAESTKEVVVRCGSYELHVKVGPTPVDVDVPHWQPTFDVINNAGSILIDDGSGADRAFLEVDDGRFDDPVDVFNWCGGGVLLRPEYLADAGLFDERFFLYYEDTDLSWRGQALGWRYRYVPTSVLRHLHSASSGEGSNVFAYHVERNRLLLLAKNAPWRLAVGQSWRYVLSTASYARRDVLGPLRHRRRPPLRLLLNRVRSYVGFLRLLPAMLVDRRAMARRRTRSHREVARAFVRRSDFDRWTAANVAEAGTRGERGERWQ
jgi:GT2 family glycosyltransferase